jgi:ABC-type dipeptide/oligopeptide/nickel transport system ATPase component
MRREEIVEDGLTAEVFAAPKHEYTWALVNSIPGAGLYHRQGNPSLKHLAVLREEGMRAVEVADRAEVGDHPAAGDDME